MQNNYHHLVTILVTSLLLATGSFAKQTEHQALFLAVEQSLERGDNQLYLESRTELEHYPLAGYLESRYLTSRLNRLDQQSVDDFVTRNPELPQTSKLQYKWLNWLARKQRWSDYLVAYRRMGLHGSRFQCLKGLALLATGDKPAAWKDAQDLWLVGESQDKACDPLFSRWKQAGQLTQSLAAQRFWLAVANGKTSLARYIDRSISSPQYKPSTALFWRVHNTPRLVNTTSLWDGHRQEHRQIMLHAVNRLASRDRERAINTWLKLRKDYPFTSSQVARTDQRLAIRQAKNFTTNAESSIARIDPHYRYPKVTGWRVRLALADQNWEEVLRLIGKLPDIEQTRDSWSYWRAVARLKLDGGVRLQPDKELFLEKLRRERSFYGFLAADLTDSPFQLNHESSDHSPSDISRLIAKHEGFSRIREWLQLDRVSQAQSELNRLKPGLTADERRLLPYVAKSFGWHHQAIMAAAKEAMWNDLDLRFPAPQHGLFNLYAEKRSIDYSWAISIARQESAFNPAARSHAGARGLMQLMPATARQAAKKSRVTYRKVSDLYKPEKNIAIGTAHLAWLADQFEGNTVFATAAYNAGGTAVRRWLRDRGHLPLDIWIETIPYDETRRYVQNVLAFRVIYSLRSDGEAQMFTPEEAIGLTLTPAEQLLIATYP